MSNDKTIRDVGTITSPKKAVELVNDFYKNPSANMVSILELNKAQEVIGIKHYDTDMNPAWRTATTSEAAKEKGCESVIVIYVKHKDFLEKLDKMIAIVEDLRAKLRAVQVGLTDVIAIGRNSFYSYADECVTRI